jgi:alkylation response protein AidB-like acyl-CoA dehydrogenase
VDFSLSEEQQLLRETARQLLRAECPATLVRAHADDPSVAQSLFDRHLRDWVALGEGDLVDLCLFLEEAGGVLLPGPFFPTTALFVPLLAAVDHPALAEATTGSLTGTLALAGRDGRWRESGDDVRTFVLEADRVDRVAIVVPGPMLAVAEATALRPRPVATLDTSRRVFEIELGGECDEDLVAVSPARLASVIERATVALAAELVGVARWLVDTAVTYARERVQFDRPIGSFQGVQFQLVDVGLDVERASAAVYYAAMCIDADDEDRHRATHVAKAAAGRAARHAAKVGLQVHGGIGYTWEHDLHLYLRRAYASDDLLGDVAWHHDQLAKLVFD